MFRRIKTALNEGNINAQNVKPNNMPIKSYAIAAN